MRILALALAACLLPIGSLRAQDSPPPAAPPRVAPPEVRGMALPMHSKEPDFDYSPMLAELREHGVTHVGVFFDVFQPNGRSAAPARHPLKTPSDRAILAMLEAARSQGLEVALVPRVLLEHPAKDEWRGNMSPPDRQGRLRGSDGYRGPNWEPWFAAYGRLTLHYARLAQEAGVAIFCVGSELSSTESETERWQALIAQVRRVFSGRLTYSANWDHYRHPGFWGELDCIGLSGYYEIASTDDDTREQMAHRWGRVRDRLIQWRLTRGLQSRPFLFLEVGYPSQDGATRRPWDYTGSRQVDLEEQRLGYQAFVDAWRGRPELLGVFFYEWWGLGGAADGGYTPRGKPALEVIRDYFDAR